MTVATFASHRDVSVVAWRWLWLTDGSCVRLRRGSRNHVLSVNFVEGRTHEWRGFRRIDVIDEFARECMANTHPNGWQTQLTAVGSFSSGMITNA